MASPLSSEPSTPRLALPRGAFPDIPGGDPSPRGGHTPDSAGTSPASLFGWTFPDRGRSSSASTTERPDLDDDDAQSVMALAAGRYRPKDWAPDPLPTSPPEGTVSG